MKYNVLVFPCGSEIGLEINNALKYSTHVEVFGGSSVENHGKYVYKNYIDGIPDVESYNFIDELNKIVHDNEIDFIFPAHDSVCIKLAENIENITCKIIGSVFETCKICRSKKATYEKFKSIIKTPKLYIGNEVDLIFPVFLKPDVGQGSRGVFLAYSVDDIDFYFKKDKSLLVCEYLPGKEYTIDCFTNKNGELLYFGSRERGRISGGISVNTFPVDCSEFAEIARKINKNLSFRGAWFFQLKRDINGELTLLEIAPRIAGSMAMHRNLGINFALLSIFDALSISVSVEYNNQYKIVMDRALCNRFSLNLNYSHVYIDLDDTIILNGKINTSVILFLFQCINEKIKVHLLSRHESRFNEDINVILSKYRILNIFDSVINVKDGECKSIHIKESGAIFIDDSFNERKLVADKLKIPVFDISNCLVRNKY